MLKKILAISGKPGLFEVLGQGKNVILVKDLVSGKKFPASMREKLMSLGDITMYADSGDLPLGEIYTRLYEKENGKKVDVKTLEKEKSFATKFAEVVPDFDRERVYTSDLRKFFTWYNILIDSGFTKFIEDEKQENGEKEESAE